MLLTIARIHQFPEHVQHEVWNIGLHMRPRATHIFHIRGMKRFLEIHHTMGLLSPLFDLRFLKSARFHLRPSDQIIARQSYADDFSLPIVAIPLFRTLSFPTLAIPRNISRGIRLTSLQLVAYFLLTAPIIMPRGSGYNSQVYSPTTLLTMHSRMRGTICQDGGLLNTGVKLFD